MPESLFKIAYPLADTVDAYDPAVPPTAARANLIYSLFSNLIAFDDTGSIQAQLAESFEWQGDSLRFRLKDRRTADGYRITAKDAAFSLKRLILLSNNAHGDLANFLCPAGLANIDDECAGIKVEGNDLVLTVTKSFQAKFLLPLLTASDFAIIPMISVKQDDPKLPITSFRNTSGPYYISADRIEQGELELEANPSDECFNGKSAKHILLIKAVAAKARELYKSGIVDAITTVDMSSAGEIETLSKQIPNSRLHHTPKIKVLNLSFSASFIEKTTPSVRLALGQAIKKAYMKAFGAEDGAEATFQFFPNLGDGSLDNSQLKLMEASIAKAEASVTTWPSSLLSTFGKELVQYGKAFAEIPGLSIELYKSKAIAIFSTSALKASDDPDLMLYPTDASYLESISLISYQVDTGAFGLTRQQGVEWLNRYMKLGEKSERLEMLRDAHLKMLLEARIVPIAVSPYSSITRKPWSPDNNPISAVTRLCQMKHD